MWTIIFLTAAVLFATKHLKWKVSTLALIYYMEKNQYKLPNDEEMKGCTGFVVKNMIKDLSRRSGNR